jgi:GT2 family glycosyltransferase
MPQAQVTVVVVPRERFSFTKPSLESLYRDTDFPFELIYVDGGSPEPTRAYLKEESKRKGFHLIRTDHYLTPNQARNLALKGVKTRYLVFMDNDILVSPGWLEALWRCAEETQAGLVGPIYCIGNPREQVVHMAGGDAHIEQKGGGRSLHEKHRLRGRRLPDVRSILRRERCELLEFHCMLARTDLFASLGPLDEQLLSTPEHIDLCLKARHAGREVYLEPDAVVSYVPPPPFARTDLPYFLLRWSEAWNRASLDHFRRKWDLSADDPFLRNHNRWLRKHRQIVLFPWGGIAGRIAKSKPCRWLLSKVLSPMEISANRLLTRKNNDVRPPVDVPKANV